VLEKSLGSFGVSALPKNSDRVALFLKSVIDEARKGERYRTSELHLPPERARLNASSRRPASKVLIDGLLASRSFIYFAKMEIYPRSADLDFYNCIFATFL